MVKLTKRFKVMTQKVPANEAAVPVDQAVAILKQFNTTKFDQTVEIAIRLGIDPKQADQLVRGSIVLPHGIGKIEAGGRVRQGRSGRGRPRRPAPTKSAPKTWPRRSRTAGPISTPASPPPT